MVVFPALSGQRCFRSRRILKICDNDSQVVVRFAGAAPPFCEALDQGVTEILRRQSGIFGQELAQALRPELFAGNRRSLEKAVGIEQAAVAVLERNGPRAVAASRK